MRTLPKPAHDAESVYLDCLTNLESEKQDRLTPLKLAVKEADATYQAMAVTRTLYGISGTVPYQGDLKEDMVNLYTNILSRNNSRLRYIYDAIRAGAKGDICPLCGQNLVKTLDHYLDKANYPIFAVSPLNLVPCCSDCNKAKALAIPSGPQEQTLHPYFDDASDQIWLHASVLEQDPVVIEYKATGPAAWPQLKQDRVQSHFSVLGLSQLYSVQAAVLLTDIRAVLVGIDESEGIAGLRKHLIEQAKSRVVANPNSWQAALFVALSTSCWFLAGGYKCLARP